MEFVYVILCSLIFSFSLNLIYFSKKHIKSGETKVFSILLVINFVGLLLELISAFIGFNFPPNSFISIFFTKMYLIYLMSFLLYMTLYIYIICYVTSKKPKVKYYNKLKKLSYFIFLVCVIIMLFLNINTNRGYATGDAINFVYICSAIVLIIWFIPYLKNRKIIEFKKILPLALFMILISFISLIQKVIPHITITTSMEFLIIFIMYHTIENPDIKMIEQLNIAKQEADRANNAKSEFLSNMSHEIRTPLNAIVGFSSALAEEDISGDAKSEVDDILMASQSLLEIVNGILDISKIEANKLEIINTEYSFKKIEEELVSLTKARIGDKPLEFRTKFDSTIPEILYGDHARLKQIILNLLTNAVKYTKEGYVEFKVDCLKKGDVCRLIISVEDTGIGIKRENISKLFSKFERLEVEKEITIEGTGLGLAITKKLVELMHGKIVVQSVYGKGSRFTVAIDQRIVVHANTKEQVESEVKDEKNIDVSGKRVLIVDDNMLNLKVASRLLQPYDLDIDTASSGQECIDRINNGILFDLILCDDMMPKMSGTKTLHKLKETPNFKIPVVALTANAISGMKDKYLKEGFDDYLSKPIEKDELNRVIAKFLSN